MNGKPWLTILPMAYQTTLYALADPTRREVLERLREGPMPVGRLARGMSVSRPAVSQHLKVLEGAGLVRARQEGTRRIYRVEVRGLMELKRYLETFWTEVLEAFREEAEAGLPKRRPRRRRAHARRTSSNKPRRSHDQD